MEQDPESIVSDAEAVSRLAPTGQFPVLVDGDRTVIESAAIIEYLDLHHGDAPPTVPADPRAAIEARQMDSVFDDYVSAPLSRIVFNALRDEDKRGSAPGDLKVRPDVSFFQPNLGWCRCPLGVINRRWIALRRCPLSPQ